MTPILPFQQLPVEIQLLVAGQLDRPQRAGQSTLHFAPLLPSNSALIYNNLHSIAGGFNLVDSLVRNPALCNIPQSLHLSAWNTPGDIYGEDEPDDESDTELDARHDPASFFSYDMPIACAKASEASHSPEEERA
jgi:hypothetical protein